VHRDARARRTGRPLARRARLHAAKVGQISRKPPIRGGFAPQSPLGDTNPEHPPQITQRELSFVRGGTHMQPQRPPFSLPGVGRSQRPPRPPPRPPSRAGADPRQPTHNASHCDGQHRSPCPQPDHCRERPGCSKRGPLRPRQQRSKDQPPRPASPTRKSETYSLTQISRSTTTPTIQLTQSPRNPVQLIARLHRPPATKRASPRTRSPVRAPAIVGRCPGTGALSCQAKPLFTTSCCCSRRAPRTMCAPRS
jgi:hypothetical protein